MLDIVIILLISVVILAKSAQIVIDNSIMLARFFRISELAVGFILISIATSLPELAVSTIASLENQTGISVGNVLGASIADIGIVLGISIFLYTTPISKKETTRVIKILIITSILPLIVLLNMGSFAGIILLIIFIIYAYSILQQKISLDGTERIKPEKAVTSAFMFMIGILLIIGSSKYVVESAVEIATLLGISKAFIAATVISLGTTLPELTVSVFAMRSRHFSLAIGNVIGSCITNLTLILGIAAVINPLIINLSTFLNLIIFLVIMNSALIYFLHYRKNLGRNEGFVLVGIYLIFLASAILVEIRT